MRAFRFLRPLFVSALTSPGARAARRGAAELRRRVRGEPRRLHYFHQVDDPYRHLTAQTRAPDFCTWGQDRLWLVEAEIRRRLASA